MKRLFDFAVENITSNHFFEKKVISFVRMPRYKIFQVIFTNNEIASVKETEKPLIGFGGKKYVSCTRFHLIFAYVKTMSISKALKEAQNIIAEFLESQTNGEMDRKDIT